MGGLHKYQPFSSYASFRKSKLAVCAEDYDPHMHRHTEKPMTNLEAFISLIKCSIGTGCLAMPLAFNSVGWVNGIIGTTAIGVTTVYAIHVLLEDMYLMCKRYCVPLMTYKEAMQLAFLSGPPILKWMSRPVSFMVDFFLTLYHFGVCCVYIVFIADNIKDVIDFYDFELDNRLYMFLLTLPLIPIFSIQDLKTLVPYSAMANLFSISGLFAILVYLIYDLPPLSERHMFKLKDYPIFFGTVLFAVESVGILIAIEANMKHPKDYLGITGVMNCSLFIVLLLYILFGFVGYWHYGDRVKGSITLNIPRNDFLSQVIKIVFALAIYISYALQGYVTIDLIWNHIFIQDIDEKDQPKVESVLRIAIVLSTVICAILFPDLSLFLSLVGAFCLSLLSLIFPALLDICVKYGSGYGPLGIHLIKAIIMILTGFIGGLIGSYFAFEQILEKYDTFYKL